MGPLHFWQLLPMPSDGPIAVATAVADDFVWAHYLFGSFSQCPYMGPLQLQQLLLMASYGPIIVFGSFFWCPRMGPLQFQQLLLMVSYGPIICSAASPNALGWAHCSSNSCCKWLHMGPLFFRQLLLMPLDGPTKTTTILRCTSHLSCLNSTLLAFISS